MAASLNLPFPLLKSTGDDKRDIEVYVEDLVDYCVMNNWYDPSKSTDDAKWIKPDKAMACLRASLTKSAGTVLKYSLGLTEENQTKPHCVIQALKEYYGASIGVSGERQKFLRLIQQDDETIGAWESRVRNQAAQCEYENFEDELMRDQFIAGLVSEQLRVKLIGKGHRHRDGDRSKVSLREVVEIAKAYESTTITNKLMKNARESQQEQVNYSNSQRRQPVNRDRRDFTIPQQTITRMCSYCGVQHKQPRQQFCPAYRKRCNKCGVLGHFARVCKSERSYHMREEKANQVQDELNEELFAVENNKDNGSAKKFFANLTLLNKRKNRVIRAQIDSAATCNTMPLNWLRKNFPGCKLGKTLATICTYGNQKIAPKGQVTLCCEAKGKFHLLDFLVVDVAEEKPALLSGCDAQKMGYLKIYADEVQAVDVESERKGTDLPPLGQLTKESIITHYGDVFKPGRGKPLGDPLHIEVDPCVKPVQSPRRRIPVAKMERVNKELERLCEEDTIAQVTQPTEWLSNMLVREKPDGRIRICIDPSRTVNKAIRRPVYTIPTIEEKLPFLTSAKVFTVVDVSEAFHNIELDYESSLLTTFQGPNGRYRYKRMPFGISSGPEEYQRRQQEFLEGLDGVINIADDICVLGRGDTKEEASIDHDKNLIALLDKCKEQDLRLTVKKMQFKSTTVTFMGHKLTDQGICPDPGKVSAVREMPRPIDKVGVQRFLGMCNYLSKFCPNLSETVLPLRNLVKKNVEFNWSHSQENAFNAAKDLIASSTNLRYYDVKLPVTLQVDASDEAIGGVLMQEGKPVCFTSHTLTDTEKQYAQIEKECLAIMTSMKYPLW